MDTDYEGTVPYPQFDDEEMPYKGLEFNSFRICLMCGTRMKKIAEDDLKTIHWERWKCMNEECGWFFEESADYVDFKHNETWSRSKVLDITKEMRFKPLTDDQIDDIWEARKSRNAIRNDLGLKNPFKED